KSRARSGMHRRRPVRCTLLLIRVPEWSFQVRSREPGRRSRMPEQTLGQYRLESQLGAGGMGVVYQATDTRLGRQVAIKLLHESHMKDPQVRARFEHEARVLASLNHPNIAALHALEEDGEVKFLVLEYVPGDTL